MMFTLANIYIYIYPFRFGPLTTSQKMEVLGINLYKTPMPKMTRAVNFSPNFIKKALKQKFRAHIFYPPSLYDMCLFSFYFQPMLAIKATNAIARISLHTHRPYAINFFLTIFFINYCLLFMSKLNV